MSLYLSGSPFRLLVPAVSALVLFAAGAASAASTFDFEPNDSIATAQNIDAFFDLSPNPQIEDLLLINTSTSIPHAEVISLLDVSGTVDYFSFTAGAGSTIILDIDCGENASSLDTGCGGFFGGIDTWIEIYDPSGALFTFNDDSGFDTGSESSGLDSLIQTVVPVGGLWTVGVGEFPGLTPISAGGDYILNVSVTPEPSTALLVGMGLAMIGARRRRLS